MKWKYILVVLIILISGNSVTAWESDIITIYASDVGFGTHSRSLQVGTTHYAALQFYNNVNNDDYNCTAYFSYNGDSPSVHCILYYTVGWGFGNGCGYIGDGESTSTSVSGWTDGYFKGWMTGTYDHYGTGRVSLHISQNPINIYTISGDLGCITSTELYIKNSDDTYSFINSNSSAVYYEFDIQEGITYKLVFGDNHEYEFICSGDETYNRDICTYSTFNIKDNCENPIINSYGYYTSEDDVMCYYFEGSSFDVLNIGQTYIDIIVHSFDGVQGYHIDNPLPNTEITYSLVNPSIQWINTIWVYDAIETHLLNDALVTLTQDCIIDTSLYPIRSQYTDAGGYACFSQCPLEGASLNVSLSGYKPFIGYIGIGDNHAFKQDQLIMVGLYPYDDPINESHYNYTNWTTSIWFKNNDSIITSEIYDTDEYVDLYYHNNNTYDSPMVLNFEMGLAGTFNTYNPILSWLILSEESGYKRIYNDNFSNHLNYYKATLEESEIEGWDKMKYLSVINHTQNVGDNYKNLTTNIWFAGTINNRIEYKEDILITSYANSNNSTLLNVSLELYNETNMIEYINLTWGDFSHPTDRWYYRWSPASGYEKNKNYTVRMFGFNYQFLKEDSVYTTDLHKNKLTVRVVDDQGNYLTNSYIVLEGYGSLSTGSTFYNSYHNLDNGMYQYKATKKGYVGAGWENVNLSDANEIVNYSLTSESSSSINTPLHFSDSDIQSFFYPLMFFLLMCLLLGGLKYVAK